MIIEILFSEIANIFGDRANAEYLSRCIPGSELVKTGLRVRPRFVSENVDVVYLGAMTESAQHIAAEALSPYTSALAERVKSGGMILLTGNAMEIFGEYIEDEDGSAVKTLGILPTYAKRIRPKRYNASYLGLYGDVPIVGFNSRFSHTYCEEDVPALFETSRGIGRNEDTLREGVRVNNLMATYLLGPLLLMNPLFCRAALNGLGAEPTELPYEAAAKLAYEKRLEEFRDPKRGFTYV